MHPFKNTFKTRDCIGIYLSYSLFLMLLIHAKENMRTQEVATSGRSKATINSLLLLFPVTKCHLKNKYIYFRHKKFQFHLLCSNNFNM